MKTRNILLLLLLAIVAPRIFGAAFPMDPTTYAPDIRLTNRPAWWLFLGPVAWTNVDGFPAGTNTGDVLVWDSARWVAASFPTNASNQVIVSAPLYTTPVGSNQLFAIYLASETSDGYMTSNMVQQLAAAVSHGAMLTNVHRVSWTNLFNKPQGTNNYVLKFVGADSFGSSSILDDGSHTSVGTTSAVARLVVGANSTAGSIGQLVLGGLTNPGQQLSIGYDVSGNYGFWQPILQGTGYKDTILNPYGGNVQIGLSNLSARVTTMGQYRIGAQSTTNQEMIIAMNGTEDPILVVGYNYKADHSLDDPTDTAAAWMIEGNYNASYAPHHPTMEGYFQFGPTNGRPYNRPLMFTWDKTTGLPTETALSGHPVTLYINTGSSMVPGSQEATLGVKQVELWTNYTKLNNAVVFGSNATLHGTASVDNNVIVGTGTNSVARIHLAGNTDSLQGQLVISGASNTNLQLHVGMDVTTTNAYIESVNAGVGFKSLSLNPHGGRVGVGTGTPTNALDVRGIASASAIHAQDGVVVGRGTNTTARLWVSGNTDQLQGQLVLSGYATNLQLHVGYDVTRSNAYVQSVNAGTGYTPLLLNPAGGRVVVAGGTNAGTNTLDVRGDLSGYRVYNSNGLITSFPGFGTTSTTAARGDIVPSSATIGDELIWTGDYWTNGIPMAPQAPMYRVLLGNQLRIDPAGSGTNGYLSSNDWAAFNAKEPAIATSAATNVWHGDKTFGPLSYTNLADRPTEADPVFLASTNGTDYSSAFSFRGYTDTPANPSPAVSIGAYGTGASYQKAYLGLGASYHANGQWRASATAPWIIDNSAGSLMFKTASGLTNGQVFTAYNRIVMALGDLTTIYGSMQITNLPSSSASAYVVADSYGNLGIRSPLVTTNQVTGLNLLFTNTALAIAAREPAIAASDATYVYHGNKAFGPLWWSEISGKPDTFAPSTHNHDGSYVPYVAGTNINDVIAWDGAAYLPKQMSVSNFYQTITNTYSADVYYSTGGVINVTGGSNTIYAVTNETDPVFTAAISSALTNYWGSKAPGTHTHPASAVTPGTFSGDYNVSGAFAVGTTNAVLAAHIVSDSSYGQLTLGGRTNENMQMMLGFNVASNVGTIQPLLQGTGYRDLALVPYGANVGVGTNSPGSKLHVAGDIRASGQVLVGGTYPALTNVIAHTQDADTITSGTFDTNRIPDLGAYKITSGTLDVARIPSLAASIITSGTIDIARLPIGTAANTVAVGNHGHGGVYEPVLGNPVATGYVLSSTDAGVRSWVSQPAAFPGFGVSHSTAAYGDHGHAGPDITSGTIDAARIPNLDGAKITSGTIPDARINGSTAATADTFVKRDSGGDIYGRMLWASQGIDCADIIQGYTMRARAGGTGFVSVDGTTGATKDVTVRNSAGTGTIVLHFKNGLFVGTTP